MHQGLDATAPAEHARQHAVAATEIERDGKAPRDVVEPVGESLRRLLDQEIRCLRRARRPRAVQAHRAAVEDAQRIAWRSHRHRACMTRRSGTRHPPDAVPKRS